MKRAIPLAKLSKPLFTHTKGSGSRRSETEAEATVETPIGHPYYKRFNSSLRSKNLNAGKPSRSGAEEANSIVAGVIA
jgi:hypothetical protein